MKAISQGEPGLNRVPHERGKLITIVNQDHSVVILMHQILSTGCARK